MKYCGEECRDAAALEDRIREAPEPVLSTCARCGNEFDGKRKYCSSACYDAANEERRRKPCSVCGEIFLPSKGFRKACSEECLNKLMVMAGQRAGAANAKRHEEAKPKRECVNCGAMFIPPSYGNNKGTSRRKTCSDECALQAAVTAGSKRHGSGGIALREALVSRDLDTALRLLQEGSFEDDRGDWVCWTWKGSRMSGGYAQGWHGKHSEDRLHRFIIEAFYGDKLGSQDGHHMCSNTLCVYPPHLQPATKAANVAEMMGRRSYEARIMECELVIHDLDPNHPILQRIPCGNVTRPWDASRA
jgi:hypothetical protein